MLPGDGAFLASVKSESIFPSTAPTVCIMGKRRLCVVNGNARSSHRLSPLCMCVMAVISHQIQLSLCCWSERAASTAGLGISRLCQSF